MSEITIMPVANGFVVTLPSMQREQNIFEQIVPTIKAMKDEMQKDSLLDELQKANVSLAPDEKVEVNFTRTPNIFCFASFGEVITFLQTTFKA